MQSDRHQHKLLQQDGHRGIEALAGRRQWSEDEKARGLCRRALLRA
jgi:hypothetical protein